MCFDSWIFVDIENWAYLMSGSPFSPGGPPVFGFGAWALLLLILSNPDLWRMLSMRALTASSIRSGANWDGSRSSLLPWISTNGHCKLWAKLWPSSFSLKSSFSGRVARLEAKTMTRGSPWKGNRSSCSRLLSNVFSTDSRMYSKEEPSE